MPLAKRTEEVTTSAHWTGSLYTLKGFYMWLRRFELL